MGSRNTVPVRHCTCQACLGLYNEPHIKATSWRDMEIVAKGNQLYNVCGVLSLSNAGQLAPPKDNLILFSSLTDSVGVGCFAVDAPGLSCR